MKWMPIAAVVAITVAGLTACGTASGTSGLNLPEYHGTSARSDAKTDGRSPQELLSAAQLALAAADSVSVRGWTIGPDRSLIADLAFAGPDGSGSYSFDGGTLQLLMVDGQTWWKGDVAVYSGFGVKTESVTRKIDDRWIIAGSSHPKLATIEVPTTRAELLDAFVDRGPAALTTGEQVIDGVHAISLTNETGTLSVAADSLLPLRLVLTGDQGQGLAFSYDDVPKPAAPPPDRILDLSDLR